MIKLADFLETFHPKSNLYENFYSIHMIHMTEEAFVFLGKFPQTKSLTMMMYGTFE